jgi:hypothetical protein
VFTPDAGYHIDSLIIDGVPQPPVPSYMFRSIQSNHTIYAAFRSSYYTIMATAGTHGSISPAGAVSILYNTDTTFVFTPDAGHHVESLIIDGVPQPAAPSYTFRSIQSNHTIHVTFNSNKYTLSATAGTHGSISPSGDLVVSYGTDTTYSFAPNPGYHVDSLLVDGALQPAAPSYTFTHISSNHTIHAAFAIDFTKFVLYQSFPNPFNPFTTIEFHVPTSAFVTLKIYDLTGRELATLVSQVFEAGKQSTQWNAAGFPSGIYFYRLQSGSFSETKKVLLLR